MVGTLSFAQQWLTSATSESGDFDYFFGEGDDRDEAYFDALDALAKQLGWVKGEFSTERKVEIIDGLRKSNYKSTASVKVEEVDLFVFPVRELRKRGKVYILIGSPKSGTEQGGILAKSNFVWRSSLAPGWGQFFNKEPTKGLLFSLGEVALIGSTLYAFNQSSNEQSNADLARLQGNIAQFNKYNQRSDNWNTTGTILGVSAVAFWVLNIIDATSSEKNLYVHLQEKKGMGLFAKGDRLGFKYSF